LSAWQIWDMLLMDMKSTAIFSVIYRLNCWGWERWVTLSMSIYNVCCINDSVCLPLPGRLFWVSEELRPHWSVYTHWLVILAKLYYWTRIKLHNLSGNNDIFNKTGNSCLVFDSLVCLSPLLSLAIAWQLRLRLAPLNQIYRYLRLNDIIWAYVN